MAASLWLLRFTSPWRHGDPRIFYCAAKGYYNQIMGARMSHRRSAHQQKPMIILSLGCQDQRDMRKIFRAPRLRPLSIDRCRGSRFGENRCRQQQETFVSDLSQTRRRGQRELA
jgi:hypothetical protein